MEGMKSAVFIVGKRGFWSFFSQKSGKPHPKWFKPHPNQFNPHPNRIKPHPNQAKPNPKPKTPHLAKRNPKKIPPPKLRGAGKAYLFNLTRCSRSAFMTTDTELNAIAAPASHGAKNPAAAIGMPTEL